MCWICVYNLLMDCHIHVSVGWVGLTWSSRLESWWPQSQGSSLISLYGMLLQPHLKFSHNSLPSYGVLSRVFMRLLLVDSILLCQKVHMWKINILIYILPRTKHVRAKCFEIKTMTLHSSLSKTHARAKYFEWKTITLHNFSKTPKVVWMR